MDKRTFLILMYCTSLLPINYAVAQWYLPNRGWLGIGLLNMFVLLFVFMLFFQSKNPSASTAKKRGIFILALLAGLIFFSGMIDQSLVRGTEWFRDKMNSTISHIVVAPGTEEVMQDTDTLGSAPQSTQTGTVTTDQTVKSSGTIILEGDTDRVITTTPVTDETALEKKEVSDTSSSYSAGVYGSVIPYLVSHYSLTNTKKMYPKFTYISTKNDLYVSFATAYSKAMIGTTINPATKVSCDTYLVLKGIATGWKVSYTGSPFAAYRAEAERQGAVNGCLSGKYVTEKTL